jgi:hypothetical protein
VVRAGHPTTYEGIFDLEAAMRSPRTSWYGHTDCRNFGSLFPCAGAASGAAACAPYVVNVVVAPDCWGVAILGVDPVVGGVSDGYKDGEEDQIHGGGELACRGGCLLLVGPRCSG